MSIMISVIKVYPALMKYVKDNGYSEIGPIMEIYDMPNNKILYRKEAILIAK
jgi:effector-binding domain-containing protein